MITSLKASTVQTAARSHNQTDERAHMPIFPINLGTELCCEKRVGYYISPSKTSPGRQYGAQTRPVSPAHIWISLGSVNHCGDVDHTRYWLEEWAFLLSEYTHTHTLCELRYQHALVSRALAQSSTTQWLNRRYSEESLLSPVGASLYYTIIWRSSLHATMPRNIRCNIMWNLQVLWLFYDHQGILFSLCHTITSFVLKYCVSCKNKKSLKCISTPHTLSQ